MAARALVPFVMMDEIPATIRSLLAKLPDCTDQCFRQNHIHGTLLQVRKVTFCDFCQTLMNFGTVSRCRFDMLLTLSIELFSLVERTSISWVCFFHYLQCSSRSSFILQPKLSTTCFSTWSSSLNQMKSFSSRMPAEHSGPLPVQGEVVSVPWYTSGRVCPAAWHCSTWITKPYFPVFSVLQRRLFFWINTQIYLLLLT